MTPEPEAFAKALQTVTTNRLQERQIAAEESARSAINNRDYTAAQEELGHAMEGQRLQQNINAKTEELMVLLREAGLGDISTADFIAELTKDQEQDGQTPDVHRADALDSESATPTRKKRDTRKNAEIMWSFVDPNTSEDDRMSFAQTVESHDGDYYSASPMRSAIKSDLSLKAEINPDVTVKDAMRERAEKAKNREWKEFYKKVQEAYGSMRALEFIDGVLYRKNPHSKKEAQLPPLPMEIRPIDEIVAACALGNPSVLENLKLLNRQFEIDESTAVRLAESHEAAAKARQTAHPEESKMDERARNGAFDREAQAARLKIMEDLLPSLQDDEEWRMLATIKGFESLKMLREISQWEGVSRDQLRLALFPKTTYVADQGTVSKYHPDDDN